MNRVNAAKPYGQKLLDIMESLKARGAASVDSPYLRSSENAKKVILLVITANRGLCGGYNSNVLKMARSRIKELAGKGIAAELHVIGKKGISFFRFQKMEMTHTAISQEDAVTFDQVADMAQHYMDEFAAEKFDRLEVISTVYYSSATQKPAVSVVLPVGETANTGLNDGRHDQKGNEGTEGASSSAGLMIFEPSAEEILTNLIPHLIKSNLYRIFLEAATAEQIYRRVAMKSASDAAADMNKQLNMTYNRIRQASITQEISEIVAGADSVQ